MKWFYHAAETEGTAKGGGRVEDIKTPVGAYCFLLFVCFQFAILLLVILFFVCFQLPMVGSKSDDCLF